MWTKTVTVADARVDEQRFAAVSVDDAEQRTDVGVRQALELRPLLHHQLDLVVGCVLCTTANTIEIR